MLIHIVGNIASGKSTLLDYIRKKYRCGVFKIDDYRKRHGATYTDKACWKKLILDVLKDKRELIFVESSGVSPFFDELNYHYIFERSATIKVIKVECSYDVCLKRHKNRPSLGLQIATAFRVEDSLVYIERKLSGKRVDYILDGMGSKEVVFKAFEEIIWQIRA